MQYSIKNDNLCLTVDTFGAKIFALKTNDNKNILLEHDAANNDADNVGMFPMVPICNRVKNNCYSLYGEKVDLNRTSADKSEYLHGQGWISEWTVDKVLPNELTLALKVNASDGYCYKAKINYALIDNNFKATLIVTHLGNAPRLYGLGFHPYFNVDEQTTLQINCSGYFKERSDQLSEPFSAALDKRFDYKDAKHIDEDYVNHLYAGFGSATLRYANDLKLKLTGIGTPYLMMYHKTHGNFVALEPQCQELDACNKAGTPGMQVLSYGDSMQVSMQIQVENQA